MFVESCGTRDEIPQIYNINLGENRQPTQDEANVLSEHFLTLNNGLIDTQVRMKETKYRVAPIRKETLGSPLSGRTLYGDELDEPYEKQQSSAKALDSKIDLPVDSPNQEEEEELPFKYPIAPQHCRRWGKPESYVISDLSTRLSDGMRC